MHAPRRWQLASVATAVTGLGLGGLLGARPGVEEVRPIVLDEELSAEELHRGPLLPVERTTEVVTPQVREHPTPVSLDTATAATPVSAASADDDTAADTADDEPAVDDDGPEPGDADDRAGSASVDEPDSVASDASTDSD